MTDSSIAGVPFVLAGAAGEPIRGNLHLPAVDPGGRLPVLLVLHGFKGYKDYGFFPWLTANLADAGLATIRFNFSHSGMDEDPSTFGRPDLFEADTWSKQLEDVQKLVAAAETGQLPHGERMDPCRIGLLGHSRGGVTALLSAGHDARFRAVATLAAPATADYLTAAQKQEIRDRGYLVSPSSRTGQKLHIGRPWLDDLAANRARLDLLHAVSRIRCPLLIVHGAADTTVPVASARVLASAYPGTAIRLIIDGAGHTFNCANPMAHTTPALDQVLAAAVDFFATHLA